MSISALLKPDIRSVLVQFPSANPLAVIEYKILDTVIDNINLSENGDSVESVTSLRQSIGAGKSPPFRKYSHYQD